MGLYDQNASIAGGASGDFLTKKVVNKGMSYFEETTEKAYHSSMNPTLAQNSPLPTTNTPQWSLDGYIYHLSNVTPFGFVRINQQTMNKEDLPALSGLTTGNALGVNLIYGKKLVFIPNDTTMNNSNMYLFDTETLAWEDPIVMPSSRSDNSVAIFGNVLYFWGGYYTSRSSESNAGQSYNFANQTWTTTGLPTLPANKKLAMGFTYGTKIYFVGGSTTATYEYDTSANTFATKATMPAAKNIFSAGVVGDKLYIAGNADSIQIYNITSNSYTNMTQGTMSYSSYVFNGLNGRGNVEFLVFVSKTIYSVEIDINNSNKIMQKLIYGLPASITSFPNMGPGGTAIRYYKPTNKFYFMPYSVGTATGTNVVDSRYLLEVDQETGTVLSYEVPEYYNGLSTISTVIWKDKVFIFFTQKTNNFTTSILANTDTTYVFDILTKTFEKKPKLLNNFSYVHINSAFIGDTLFTTFNEGSYTKISAYNFSEDGVVENVILNNSYAASYPMTYDEKINKIYALYHSGTSSSASTMLYSVDVSAQILDQVWNLGQGNIEPNVGMANTSIFAYNGFIYFFNSNGYIDMFDVANSSFLPKKATISLVDGTPKGVGFNSGGADGFKATRNGTELKFKVGEEVYKSTKIEKLKLFAGDVMMFDEEGNYLRSYTSDSYSSADIDMLPGFTLKYSNGKKIIILG